MSKAIMIQGTASGVGKTILTLALCRIFKEDGYKTAPFKAQNITPNTCLTANGEEIAISQWLQAMAAGVSPCANMNPVLLKPSSGKQETQIIVRGKPYDAVSLYDFKGLKEKIIPEIADAYSSLCEQYDVIVIEGAGSPVELNLKENDIVNMGMAKLARSPVILISDIDRGGIFASLYGTLELLSDSERAYVKAVAVNRFKGEARFFEDGKAILESITKRPVAGIIPAIKIDLPEEDCPDSNFHTDTDFENQFDNIANEFRKALEMDLIYEILEKGM